MKAEHIITIFTIFTLWPNLSRGNLLKNLLLGQPILGLSSGLIPLPPRSQSRHRHPLVLRLALVVSQIMITQVQIVLILEKNLRRVLTLSE